MAESTDATLVPETAAATTATPAVQYERSSYAPEEPGGDVWVLNLGPQHPATHTTPRHVLELDGERECTRASPPHPLHRPLDKLCFIAGPGSALSNLGGAIRFLEFASQAGAKAADGVVAAIAP